MLYEHPEVYDALLSPGYHLAHYAALAERYPGPVLELACGTGQLLVPIAQGGREAVGLDLSRPMLDAARQRASRAGVAVELVEGDMREFDLGRRFSLVFVARNSLLHLSAAEDFLATFAAVRRHLMPGGAFALDVFNPSVRMLAQPAGERHLVMRRPTDAFGELTVEEIADYDAATQVNRATWYISAPGRPDAWVAPLELRSIFPQELPLLLAAGGFRLLSRAGDMDGSPFTSDSMRQVCVCEPAVPA